MAVELRCPETRLWVQALHLERYPRKQSESREARQGRKEEGQKGGLSEWVKVRGTWGSVLPGPLGKAVETTVQNRSPRGENTWLFVWVLPPQPAPLGSPACSHSQRKPSDRKATQRQRARETETHTHRVFEVQSSQRTQGTVPPHLQVTSRVTEQRRGWYLLTGVLLNPHP